jgi:three-Cys-motif partner protein
MAASTSVIDGDDGLPAEEVGIWVKEKHTYLRRYLDISRSTRKKYLGLGKAGATFVDLFSGPGRARIRDTGEWIDGSAMAAWKISVEGNSAFSQIYVADIDSGRRAACVERLRRLRAPVTELTGTAVVAARAFATAVSPLGLHFAFLDPYSLSTLDFGIIRQLSALKRIDMLIHLSAMDLQRNLDMNVGSEDSSFDSFSPGWRQKVDLAHSQLETRRLVVE